MRRRTFLAAGGVLSAFGDSWSRQRIGANCFNRRLTPAWLDAAAAASIRTVRLAYEKWGGRDFLLGSADVYRGLVAADLRQLIDALDGFASRGIGVVLTPLTLPGARWRQMNGGRRDGRLWTSRSYWDQARRFWRDLAVELHQHPAILAFDILNEPAPELEYGRRSFWTPDPNVMKGTPGDLTLFYRHVLESIRQVSATIPVVWESGLFATPWTLESLEPLWNDPNVLYSIHMYEPYEYTTWRKHKGTLRYPGSVPIEDTGRHVSVNAGWLTRFFDPVRQWMMHHALPPERLLIGEFGCDRRNSGAGPYLRDLLQIFDRERWHWLFYSYREDTWDAMDYELGTQPPPPWYWSLAEKNDLPRRYQDLYAPLRDNSLWQVLAGRLKAPSP